MTLGIPSGKSAVGAVPRTSLDVAHDHIRVRLHEDGGSAGLVSYTGQVSGSTVSGTWTLGGTTTNSWDAEGAITPSGDNFILFDDQSLDPLFRLDTLTSGGLLILATINKTTEQTGTSTKLFQWGAASVTSPGGVFAAITSSPNFVMQVVPPDTQSGVAATQSISETAQDLTLCGFVDVANSTIYAAKDGDFASAATGDLSAIVTAGNLPSSTSSLFGFSLLSGHNAAASSANNFLNLTTGDATVSDFWVVRLETDYLSSIGAIFTAYTANKRETPLGLT